jgi:hypothetical protein
MTQTLYKATAKGQVEMTDKEATEFLADRAKAALEPVVIRKTLEQRVVALEEALELLKLK